MPCSPARGRSKPRCGGAGGGARRRLRAQSRSRRACGASRARSLAARPDVQAVLPAPRPRPVLDVATATTGATSWWAAGHAGGEGSSDSVPSDAAVLGEAPDPTHPAFSGVAIDLPPNPRVTNHGTHTAGALASNDGTYPGLAPGLDHLIGSGVGATGTWSNDIAYALGVDSSVANGSGDPAESISESFATGMLSDHTNDDRRRRHGRVRGRPRRRQRATPVVPARSTTATTTA